MIHIQSTTDGERIVRENSNQKRDGMAILLPDTINYKPKTVARDKGKYYVDKMVNSSRRYKTYTHTNQTAEPQNI